MIRTKGILLLAVLTFCVPVHAQIEDLPETATGARALPFVDVTIGVWGSFFWGAIGHNSVQQYIWGEGGEKIDDTLDSLGIDIQADSGVLSYTILFHIASGAVSVSGEIDKNAGETLEEAFERNYSSGDLNPVALGMAFLGDPFSGYNGSSDPGSGAGGGGGWSGGSNRYGNNSGQTWGAFGGGQYNDNYCGPGTRYICVYH